MLRCHEVTHLVASDEIARLGLWKRVELRLHLLMCRHCRHYVQQLQRIREAARRLWAEEPDPAAEAALREKVLAALQPEIEARRDDGAGGPPPPPAGG